MTKGLGEQEMTNDELCPLNKILINPFVIIDFQSRDVNDITRYFDALDDRDRVKIHRLI